MVKPQKRNPSPSKAWVRATSTMKKALRLCQAKGIFLITFFPVNTWKVIRASSRKPNQIFNGTPEIKGTIIAVTASLFSLNKKLLLKPY